MLLQLTNIHKAYGKKDEAGYQQVLKGVDLEIESGSNIAIVGPSGCGKSTLLNIMGTLDYPDEGDFMFKERNINSLNSGEIDHFRNEEIGFVFQFHHLLPQCNVLENVLLPTMLKKDRSQGKQYGEELLNKVGMWEHRFKKPSQLSGGECQRVALIRAMINKPSLILADEPTGALDGKNADTIAQLLFKLNEDEKVALVLVTHSHELAALTAAKYELKEGKLLTV